MTQPTQPGAFIERGPADWQIVQQDADGLASMTVAGHWQAPAKTATVQVRLVQEDTGAPAGVPPADSSCMTPMPAFTGLEVQPS